jgi:hypothetical protein
VPSTARRSNYQAGEIAILPITCPTVGDRAKGYATPRQASESLEREVRSFEEVKNGGTRG